MKNNISLLVILLCMMSTKALAYDIAVENSDGITIYYNYYNNGKELVVTGAKYGGVTAIVIPDEVTYMDRTRKVTRIGERAFEGTSIQSVVIPNNVKRICEYAFYNSNLTSVVIPNGVTVIEEGAFASTSLRNVILGDGLTIIEPYAFRNNHNLTTIKFGKKINKIWHEAFSGCDGLKKVIVSDLKKWCGVIFGYNQWHQFGLTFDMYDYSKGANPLDYAHHLYSTDDTEIVDLVIPNGVSTIKSIAFRSCIGLKSVRFPNSVTVIESAFGGCDSLNSIYIGSKIKKIDNGFYGCKAIKRVEIADIASWSEMECSESPCYYSRSLIYNGEEITNLTIPEGVVNIGNFAYLDNLTQVTIPISAETIKDNAFYGCNKLEIVVLPNGIKNVGSNAFKDCTSLTSVDIGENVQTIGMYAFNCPNMSQVTSRTKKPSAIYGKNENGPVFSDNTFYNATLCVPKGTTSIYKKTTGWKDFVWIQGKDLNTEIEQIKNDNITERLRYDLNGHSIDNPNRGINIIKFNDGTTKKIVVK